MGLTYKYKIVFVVNIELTPVSSRLNASIATDRSATQAIWTNTCGCTLKETLLISTFLKYQFFSNQFYVVIVMFCSCRCDCCGKILVRKRDLDRHMKSRHAQVLQKNVYKVHVPVWKRTIFFLNSANLNVLLIVKMFVIFYFINLNV